MRAMGWKRTALAVGAAAVLALAAVGCDFVLGTAPGQLDPGFGDGAGFVSFAGRARSDEDVVAATRQPDGKVVSVVQAGANVELVRQQPDGSLDPSFGTGGRAPTAFAGPFVRQVVITPDGHIVVVGGQVGGNVFVWLVARYEADGSPDPDFGSNGIATLD